MRMGFSLQLEQTQKLVMTPQLQQAIKILQLTSIELDQFIQAQLETNPFLDINEEAPIEHEKIDKKKEIDWKEYSQQQNEVSDYKGQSYNSENDFSYENIVSERQTLQDYLINQLYLTLLMASHREIGEYIINSLDENGYLTTDLEEIIREFNVDHTTVEGILKIIQTFDPPGVAARNLKETLLIQLDHMGVTCSKIHQIISESLEEIADNKFPHIAKKMGISVEEVQGICDFIRTLEPKPGRRFSYDRNSYIVPDAVVKVLNDEFIIVLNDYNAPRLIIREDYKRLLMGCEEKEETIKFINDKLNSASWLLRSIEQRRQTIYNVISVIIEKQKAFFRYGKKHLKPMTLKEVADEIKVHESTVSRATSGKYVETPVGTFELKYFFSSGIEGIDGEGVSSESIKSFIKEIIDGENPKKPFSDNKIAQMLTKKGMPISRRTVAKYRDDLLIAASSKRKRF
ncbi:RNA polymerase factor sigma-54 [Alkaliphilus serpentinus]|uniref:RNA polymerase factor sigma-54 n=1 Tax=Alkaliphilus serpentinus TaxID=1482731 RepID=A0A833HNX7_9FIRM|nr:RNA polymerase factor sigma-54 [Alkaliphilus serpentinus]KAB3530200.1 RNA polymerase factor sigma-54 [Alkaliphilus serpentinus]